MVKMVISCPSFGKKRKSKDVVAAVIGEDNICELAARCDGRAKEGLTCSYWGRKVKSSKAKEQENKRDWDKALCAYESSERSGNLATEMVFCVAADKKGGVTRKVLDIILEKDEFSSVLAGALLRDYGAALSFVRLIDKVKSGKNKNTQNYQKHIRIFVDYMGKKMVEEYAGMTESERNVASRLLAQLKLSYICKYDPPNSDMPASVCATAIVQKEKEQNCYCSTAVFLVTASELDELIEDKLRVYTETTAEDKYAILSKVKIMGTLLDIISDENCDSDSEKISRIRSYLFNSGVRQIGNPGDIVVFDTSFYTIESGSPLPGEKAELIMPYWIYGGIVVKKGKVKGGIANGSNMR